MSRKAPPPPKKKDSKNFDFQKSQHNFFLSPWYLPIWTNLNPLHKWRPPQSRLPCQAQPSPTDSSHARPSPIDGALVRLGQGVLFRGALEILLWKLLTRIQNWYGTCNGQEGKVMPHKGSFEGFQPVQSIMW